MKSIMYHYVRKFDTELPKMNFLHINDLKKQLDYFQKNYYFPTKDDFISSIKTKTIIPNSIILTFDDGIKDHVLAEDVKDRPQALLRYDCNEFPNGQIYKRPVR